MRVQSGFCQSSDCPLTRVSVLRASTIFIIIGDEEEELGSGGVTFWFPQSHVLQKTSLILKVKYAGLSGGIMVSALDSGSSGLGSSPGLGHCVVFLGKTLYSHSASLYPGVRV